MQTFILFALAAWHGFNGFFMLLVPARWYESVPGVTHTGAFNGHFIADIGIAFLASAVGLALAARKSGRIAAALLIAPTAFLGGHAVLHVVEFSHGHLTSMDILRDSLLILVPGLLPALFAFRNSQSRAIGEKPC